uniref:Uncharacterized protein n=1 Tax=Arundo donax TaxID=35708 RepID=A0A0A9BHH0_ARUDO
MVLQAGDVPQRGWHGVHLPTGQRSCCFWKIRFDLTILHLRWRLEKIVHAHRSRSGIR